jgi:hypothetical protein
MKQSAMATEEKNKIKSKAFVEASALLDEAVAVLKTTKVEFGYYQSSIKVRKVCILAHKALMIAIDAWLRVRGVRFTGKKSFKFYWQAAKELDDPMYSYFEVIHNMLYEDCYQNGFTEVDFVNNAVELVKAMVVKKIRPWRRS